MNYSYNFLNERITFDSITDSQFKIVILSKNIPKEFLLLI